MLWNYNNNLVNQETLINLIESTFLGLKSRYLVRSYLNKLALAHLHLGIAWRNSFYCI